MYYSIGEVSDLTGLKPYVLRYWETEFSNLSPGKNRAGNRVYTEKDIETILEIKRLLYQDKFTIQGARQYFNNTPASTNESEPVLPNKAGAIREKEIARRALLDVQESLNELIELIREHK
ncbi:MerR family transcriptional regulator [Candidatus Neomarinimicrobiota bacterium]